MDIDIDDDDLCVDVDDAVVDHVDDDVAMKYCYH